VDKGSSISFPQKLIDDHWIRKSYTKQLRNVTGSGDAIDVQNVQIGKSTQPILQIQDKCGDELLVVHTTFQ
jgi:hypothetical protein